MESNELDTPWPQSPQARRAAQLATGLRGRLHACPEPAGCERQTKALLREFLAQNTSLEVRECGPGFYAAHREAKTSRPAIALRADYDALPLEGGGAAHLCGHDGHAAALCGVGLLLEKEALGRDVFLLFQPAEETGEGAKGCLALLEEELVAEIYGAHNLPGLPLGQVYTRGGVFACASRGLTLRMTGRQTHAATPELGRSPAGALGRLLCALPAPTPPKSDTGLTLCTAAGARLGKKAFGIAAADAEVWLTLRAERDEPLEEMQREIVEKMHALASADGLACGWQTQDDFCATVNDAACAQKVLNACRGRVLDAPMRWSEDFGQYLRHCAGAFFGIGAGDAPPLHSADYEYPDPLLWPTMQAFMNILAF